MSKAKAVFTPLRIKKKTNIGNSPLSKLTRKGNTRKKYRGQGK